MNKSIKYLIAGFCLFQLSSCEPVNENLINGDHIQDNANYAEGILMNGYRGLINHTTFTVEATDDAVNNQTGNGLSRMATGELSALYNPLNRWGKYENIFYINKFLGMVDNVLWKEDPEFNELYIRRMKGEALALRALIHMYILQAHSGYDESGTLMGIPYYTEFIESDGNFNVPRKTFKECVDLIDKDFNDAFDLLPYIYSDNASDIPEKDKKYNQGKYLAVNGTKYNLRIQGQIVRGLQARLHLMAASPAFLNSEEHYKLAAKYAGELLAKIDYKLAEDGVEFYDADNDLDNPEIFWRGNREESAWLEQNNFPYTLNGKGNINPSQNLVDAFYKADGYPITSSEGVKYDVQNPYENRDPRLAKYILFNGGKLGNKTIWINSGSDDGVNKIVNRSTRTGYYLKKLLRSDVVIPTSGNTTNKQHFPVYMRYTELFLILAEALNEMEGPDYKEAGIAVSSRDIIRNIRKRAMGLDSDPYLDNISDQSAMRELIKNERRLELCFEGFRFWDLRRYKDALNETVRGVNNDGSEYSPIANVEIRAMEGEKYFYMPLPNSEVLKYDALTQNKGW